MSEDIIREMFIKNVGLTPEQLIEKYEQNASSLSQKEIEGLYKFLEELNGINVGLEAIPDYFSIEESASDFLKKTSSTKANPQDKTSLGGIIDTIKNVFK